MRRETQGVNEQCMQTEGVGITWYRALPLSERLKSWKHVSSNLQAGSHERCMQAQHKLNQWKALPSFRDHPAAFVERVEAEGISEAQLLTLLAEPAESLQQRLADTLPWIEALREAFAYQSEVPWLEIDHQAILSEKMVQGHEGFLPIFIPLLHLAHDRLRDQLRQRTQLQGVPMLPFDPNTVAWLFLTQLAQRVLVLSSKVLVSELHLARGHGDLFGAEPEERFDDFVRQYSQPGAMMILLERYPVLGRFLVLALESWLKTTLELLCRLGEDWSLICAQVFPDQDPGMLIKQEGNAGDSHRGGRSVCLLIFQSGVRLVYKPHSLAVDGHFQELLVWINEQHILPLLQSPRTVNRGSYGWSEYIEAKACTSPAQVERFMIRLGAFLALLSLLAATDMHVDNICAAGEYPVLFDLECLFHSTLKRTSSTHSNPAFRALSSSVLTTGLLPFRLWSSSQQPGVDLSGMQTATPQRFPLPQPYWDQVNTDQMRLNRKMRSIPPSHNRPRLFTQDVSYCQYQEQILAGFTRLYRFLMEQRTYLLITILPSFAQDEIRHVVRPTAYYELLLRDQTHPDVVRDALDQERHLDYLWRTARGHLYLPELVAAERADLWAGDIPFFWTVPGSRSLFTTTGSILPEMLNETGLERARTRLMNLCEDDLARQRWIIQASLTMNAPEGHKQSAVWELPLHSKRKGTPWPATVERLQQAAFTLGDRITSLALTEGSEVGWLTIAPLREHEWKIQAADDHLYRGLAGIALFLAYLGKVGPCERSTRLARQIVSTLEQQDTHTSSPRPTDHQGIGCFMGKSGMCYLLTHLGALWHDTELLVAAHRHVHALAPLIDVDEHLDLISGSAGCIAALLALHTVAPGADLLMLATTCAHRLIQRLDLASVCTRGGNAHLWKHFHQRDVMTGFSHGTAGMALSLVRLATLTHEPSLRQAAQVLLAYERSCFSSERQNWPQVAERRSSASLQLSTDIQDLGTEPISPWFQTSWCHGAAGIGLSRLAMQDDLADPLFAQEITTAIQTTLREGFGRNHSLCHGDLGNLELLLMAKLCGLRAYQKDLECLTADILAQGETQGWICGSSERCEVPDLMTGLAGIGYQLLRLSDPVSLPSVLILAPPLPPVKQR